MRDTKAVFGDDDRMFSADLVDALKADPESEWRDLWGKELDQRRLAKELRRYGVESQEVRIGAVNRKGYLVPGATGLAQAWHRYLSHAHERDNRDKGDIAGQSVADVSRIDAERDERDTSATPEMPSELGLFDSVADVADVAPTGGTSGRNGQANAQFVPPTGPGRCHECGFHVATQGHRDGCSAKTRAPIGGITPATTGMTDRVVAALAKAVER
ncbi:DUF3631 domain-containing protein [Mycobacterium riyadhense]|uniref:DUF3631 domain-containing protein n=1 Tax=Mycobacterium riyadhense TaxID=486698 RepID=UPI0023BACC68|nr:DUF3631 domain-containing protein [Mycobacterium riyadhense]